MGIRTHHLLSGSTSSGSPAIRPCKPMRSPVEYIVVLGTDNLNRRLVDNGVLEKYNEAINLAFQSCFILPIWRRMNTQRSCFLTSIHVVLCRSLERDWDQNKEMRGWGLGERSDLLPDNGDSEDDLDSDE